MLPWPLPVAPREPNSSTVTRRVELERPVLRQPADEPVGGDHRADGV